MSTTHSAEVSRLIETLQLVAHPEGGWYRETYRSPWKTATPLGERNLATLIYYLLPVGSASRIHRVSWDEIWLWQGGGVLDLKMYSDPNLAPELIRGLNAFSPQQVIPAGTWFNAVVTEGDYVLAACLVAPGFEFADLEFRSLQG